jgi:putative PIN family toxin of toxin-antitoxin system
MPRRAVAKAFTDAEVAVSPQLLNEYRDVPLALAARNKINHEQFKALITGIAAFASVARVVFPQKTLSLCRDPKDNMVLECCHEARADILITGDRDLLELKYLPFSLIIQSPSVYVKG